MHKKFAMANMTEAEKDQFAVEGALEKILEQRPRALVMAYVFVDEEGKEQIGTATHVDNVLESAGLIDMIKTRHLSKALAMFTRFTVKD